MSETLFKPEIKTYICKFKHSNGKIYSREKEYETKLLKVEKYFNDNVDKYSIFKNNVNKYISIQDKARYLQSITKLSLTCCRNYIIKNKF